MISGRGNGGSVFSASLRLGSEWKAHGSEVFRERVVVRPGGTKVAWAERENNLILSVLHGELRRRGAGHGWVVREDGATRLAALQTPAHYLLLSLGSTAAARHAAERVEGEFPGVVGPKDVTDAFAEMWAHRRACDSRLNAEMTFSLSMPWVRLFGRAGACGARRRKSSKLCCRWRQPRRAI